MRRPWRWILAALTAAGVLLTFPAAAVADVDDFSYAQWEVVYQLSLDDEDRAVAEVTETLIAQFPEIDQNRGIVRALPLRYQGASAAPENISVTDEHGAPVPFETEQDDTFLAILVGDDSYVHGTQHYVISYTLRDVVLAATETGVDEFYWDLVPLERHQPIESFRAELVFAPELASHLTGAASCYFGPAGSTQRCEIASPDPASLAARSFEAGAAVLEVPAMPLAAGSGVTVAVALDPGTAQQPPERLPNAALDVLPMALGGAGAAAGIAGALAIARMRHTRRTSRGTIVAQYEVPDGLPPLLAGPILGQPKTVAAAEFIHLAVRGAIRIEEDSTGGKRFGGRARPMFRLMDPARASDDLDRRMLEKLFPSGTVGESFTVPKRDEKFGERIQAVVTAGRTAAERRGYVTKARNRIAVILGFIALGIAAIAALLLILGSERDNGLTQFVTVIGIIGAALFGFIALMKHRVHTARGAEAREHLEGVRLFVSVAETERLRVLQGYQGAERRADGSVNVVHLYERLLPYAMLFGLEKEWGRVLEVTYRDADVTSPYWYPALGVAGLGNLGSSLSTFTGSLSSSASYTSSSSGGSSGGGFSGGGGGGGFSGGR